MRIYESGTIKEELLTGFQSPASEFAEKPVSFDERYGIGNPGLKLLTVETDFPQFGVFKNDQLLVDLSKRPWFKNIHPKYSTPHIATYATGVFVAIAAGAMPMSLVGELVSIGTLLAFVLVCAGVFILRKTHPEIKRPFRTPVYWIIAPLGMVSCLWVMTGLPHDTWLRLAIWLVIGFFIYFGYGLKNSILQNKR
jgi:amino acid transporter